MSEPVYFLRLEVINFRCFKREVMLDFSDGQGNWKKWTVILGDNGTGKSSLLELLASYEIEESKSNKGVVEYAPKLSIAPLNKIVKMTDDNLGTCIVYLNIHWISGTNFEDQLKNPLIDSVPIPTRVYRDHRLNKLKCFGYGANRKMGEGGLTNLVNNNSETLFDENAKLINAEEWLLQLDYAASKESNIKGFAIDKRNQVKQILIDLLPDIEKIRFTEPTKQSLKSTVEFKTPYGWVNIHQLSLGYKTMIAWMVDLAARMFERYPDSENPLTEPAIVLVDEIDLHLHPKWQRKIFDYLSERFPKTQFIVTAHSPLVVQSAPKDANIVLLRKEDDHVIIDNDIKSVRNWRVDQILTSELFEIESARRPEISQWLEERTELLQKQTLTAEEKNRLDELNQKTRNLPTADNQEDIEAMELIRKVANYLKNQKA